MIARSAYWKMLTWNYEHDFIMSVSATVDAYVTGLQPPWNEEDWNGIADAIHAGGVNVAEDIMIDMQSNWGSV